MIEDRLRRAMGPKDKGDHIVPEDGILLIIRLIASNTCLKTNRKFTSFYNRKTTQFIPGFQLYSLTPRAW